MQQKPTLLDELENKELQWYVHLIFFKDLEIVRVILSLACFE